MDPETYRRQGAIVHAWGPFRVRAPTTLETEGRPGRVMSWHMVSIMLEPDNTGGEQREQALGPLDNVDVTLPGLVKMLRKKLHTLKHSIEVWERHLHEMEQPERISALQEALDEEARERDAKGDETDEADKWEWTTTAEEVLANQHEERIRLQTLYDAVQAGLHDLEEEFPQLKADG